MSANESCSDAITLHQCRRYLMFSKEKKVYKYSYYGKLHATSTNKSDKLPEYMICFKFSKFVTNDVNKLEDAEQ